MATKVSTDANRRPSTGAAIRSPLSPSSLIGLLTTGGAYALFTSSAIGARPDRRGGGDGRGRPEAVRGELRHLPRLILQGTDAAARASIGVGAASVDFQVGTGRMPLAASGPQAQQKPVQFTEEQVTAIAAYVASLAPGPAIPSEEYLQGDGDATNGAELFRINCAMCHNVAGAGGALTEGKYAPGSGGRRRRRTSTRPW